MIRKLVVVLALATLACAGIQAQQNPTQQPQAQPPAADQAPATPAPATPTPATQVPAAQTPASQESSSSQEASADELGRRRRVKAHDYKNWTYNVDAGANLARGTTKTFVKGGGVLGGAGVARNFNKHFGFRLDFQFVNLPLRASALQLAQSPSASNHVYALTLDPIINVPVTQRYTAYFLIGPGYYHRSGTLNSSTAVPGTACNAFFDWWGTCYIASLPLDKNFKAESQDEFGYNFGGGVARKVSKNTEVYGEFRQQHGVHSGITTDWRSVTIGVRW